MRLWQQLYLVFAVLLITALIGSYMIFMQLKNPQQIIITMLVFGAFLLMLSVLIIKISLLSIENLVEHLKKFRQKDYLVIKKLPIAKDSRFIIDVVNDMIIKFRMLFSEQADLNKQMRERAYKDWLTGVGNRRYFEKLFTHWINGTEFSLGGAFCLFKINNLEEQRQKWGIHYADLLLKRVAQVLSTEKSYQLSLLCRFADAYFVFLVHRIEDSEIEKIANTVLRSVDAINEDDFIKEQAVFHMGIAMFSKDNYLEDIFDKAQQGLKIIEEEAKSTYHLFTLLSEQPFKGIQWREFFLEKIQQKDILLQFQPVFYYEHNGTLLYHSEALLRLKTDNRDMLFAGLLLPMIEQLGLSVTVDKLVIKMVVDRVVDMPEGEQRFAINISESSLQDLSMLEWFACQCADLKLNARRLTIEFPEFYLKDNLRFIKAWVDKLAPYGIQIGIDHFGCGFSSYAYLEQLKIDYIKINGSYMRDIETDLDNQMIVRSFIKIAHSLDIVVIATNIETEEQHDVVIGLKVDGMQGNFMGQPI